MGRDTAIAWTDRTWNPWQGCHKVSAGCANCYMFAEKKRYGGDPATVVRSKAPTFNAPVSKKWSTPARVFTCSWSDWFIEEADAWRPEAWDIIRRTPHLTYQILTKRPERMAECLPPDWGDGYSNVWLGVSVEDQAAAYARIPHLIETPAAVRFLSCEPLLGAVDLSPWLVADLGGRGQARLNLLHWVIVGAESGPRARTCELAWISSLVAECRSASIPAFVKQLGAHPYPRRIPRPDAGRDAYTLETLNIRDRKGGDMSEWPEDLRIRQFPETP